MKEINPNVMESIGKTIHRVQDVEKIYTEFISKKKKKLLLKKNNEYIINIKYLLKENSPKQLLYEIISDFGFSDVVSVFNSLKSESGKEFFNEDYYMIKDRSKLIISNDTGPGHIAALSNVNTLWLALDNKITKSNLSYRKNSYLLLKDSINKLGVEEVKDFISTKSLLDKV